MLIIPPVLVECLQCFDGRQTELERVIQTARLLGRAVQHELDHLNGILFIDRMSNQSRLELQADLQALQLATKEALKKR